MNIKDFSSSLDYFMRAELTPFIWGHAGIGKSSIVKQYAESKGFHFFPFYLGTQSDLGDILGLAEFVDNKDGSKSTAFATPKWLHDAIEYCNENPSSGAVIFLDEFNRARKDILSGMFSLALDKSFHTLKLPKNCFIIAAGNPPTDEYTVTDVDETALMARFAHIKLEPTFEEWALYATNTKLNSSLIAFLKNQPDLLEQKHSDFSLPVKVDRRSYERLNRLMKLNMPMHLLEQAMTGIIGIERTVAYLQFLKMSDKPLEGNAILDKNNRHLIEKWSAPTNVISSLLNLTCDNLKELVTARKENFSAEEKESLFWVLNTVPKDVSFVLIKSLITLRTAVFKDFFIDPLYEKPLIELVKTALGTETKEAV